MYIAIAVTIARRIHLFSSRTQKLSFATPKVLVGQLTGRIGSCRIQLRNTLVLTNKGVSLYTVSSLLPFAYEVLVGRAIKNGVKPQPDDSCQPRIIRTPPKRRYFRAFQQIRLRPYGEYEQSRLHQKSSKIAVFWLLASLASRF